MFSCLYGLNALNAIKVIDKATVCPSGTPHENFVLACKKKGGSVRGNKKRGCCCSS